MGEGRDLASPSPRVGRRQEQFTLDARIAANACDTARSAEDRLQRAQSNFFRLLKP